MRLTSIIAIYSLFWVLSAFLVMPFGVRTHDELGEAKVPGQADSAPARFRPAVIMLRATILAAGLFGLYYLNYVQGWVSVEDLDLFRNGPPGYKDPEYLRPTPAAPPSVP
jgi:predicted secreted protein